ncbi:MAG: glycosyltransferase family 1 protein [Opitutae bacterium]|nr:glycosyltransferase family 1 protein [Opitutae bacterium]
MRIAYLCGSFLTSRGGAELYVHRLAGELARLGHELTVISAEGPLEPLPGSPYRVVALRRNRRRERMAQGLLALEKVRGCYRLAQWLFRSGSLRLLAPGPCCPALEKKGFLAEFDVVVLVRGGSAWPVQLRRVMAHRSDKLTVAVPLLHVRESGSIFPVLRRLYASYDLVIALSECESVWMKEQGWGGERILAVGAGSDEPALPAKRGDFRKRHGLPSQAPLVAFVARKIYNKGVQHLVEAMDLVWDREPQARLALLGFSHNSPGWIPGLIGKLRHPAEGRILNLDDVSESEREQALEDCDVFCMPSIGDSFGIAYLDAWRHRKPVIGCRGCSSESIIAHGRTGLLVEFGNVGEIAAAIETLLSDEAARTAMGEAGFLEWRQKGTWELIARKTESVFRERLPAKNRGGGEGGR